VSEFESAQLLLTHPLEHCETQSESELQEYCLDLSEHLDINIKIKAEPISTTSAINNIVWIVIFFII
jgi:hypothetical protein